MQLSHKQLKDTGRQYGTRVRREASRLEPTCSQLMAADQARGFGWKQAEWSRPGTFRETCLARAERGQTAASPEQPVGS